MPKALLEQAELPEEVELRAEPGRLVVSAASPPRADWEEAAQAMHAAGDDQLLDEPAPTRFEDEAWQW